ncbi:MAG: saccharopine dehydrogenase [Deltaproteobacteria bacterium CG07_land_8_20_14_0_80_38_7]|nr:MAG: saccharopine dehydrogenase [Deltaproteobacteria bacterium CG07_land_8_20_14_0_80_38_7]
MKKNILILGAGLVAGPHIEYLLSKKDLKVTVASRTVQKAKDLTKGAENSAAISLDVNDIVALNNLIKTADLVVSLLPYVHHVTVANICIEHKKHMVTTSYVSEEMRKLDEKAKNAGILILNEIGLDPGIDHMSAMKIIHEIQSKGGKVTSFQSSCGGLPSPEANTNPFGYKFSWSPHGVVLAGRNNAQHLKDGKVIKINGEDLFDNFWIKHVDSLGDFEVYPNRDSLSYIETYGLKGISTMFRGTFRNIGWCNTWKKIAMLGLLDNEKKYDFEHLTYSSFLKKLINGQEDDIRRAVAGYLKLDYNSEILNRIEWLGLFKNIKPSLKQGSALDILVSVLYEHMQYQPGESDMVVLQHEFECEYDNKKEKILSTLIDFGIPNGASSMSRTVGLPSAIAANMILHGDIKLNGVHIPVLPEIYQPILAELSKSGIKFEERRN